MEQEKMNKIWIKNRQLIVSISENISKYFYSKEYLNNVETFKKCYKELESFKWTNQNFKNKIAKEYKNTKEMNLIEKIAGKEEELVAEINTHHTSMSEKVKEIKTELDNLINLKDDCNKLIALTKAKNDSLAKVDRINIAMAFLEKGVKENPDLIYGVCEQGYKVNLSATKIGNDDFSPNILTNILNAKYVNSNKQTNNDNCQ